jgi:periplasmic divalent cation tolerance protein
MEIVAILTTIDSAERAQGIASALVERKLAACVQISEVESVYSWQGTVQREREFRIMAKTLAGRYADAEAAIRELHTYELPAIYAVPVTEVFAPYADWVAENVAE